MVAETVRRFGRLDIIYNNAGIGNAKPVHEMTEEEWDRVVDVDLKGVFLGSKYALLEMMRHGGVDPEYRFGGWVSKVCATWRTTAPPRRG